MPVRLANDRLMTVNERLCTRPQKRQTTDELKIHLAIIGFGCTAEEAWQSVMGDEPMYRVFFASGTDCEKAQFAVSAWNKNSN